MRKAAIDSLRDTVKNKDVARAQRVAKVVGHVLTDEVGKVVETIDNHVYEILANLEKLEMYGKVHPSTKWASWLHDAITSPGYKAVEKFDTIIKAARHLYMTRGS